MIHVVINGAAGRMGRRLVALAGADAELALAGALEHGGSDLLVSVDHAEDLFERLQAAGVPAELYRMHLRGHIAAFLTDGTAVERAIGFLDRTMPHR